NYGSQFAVVREACFHSLEPGIDCQFSETQRAAEVLPLLFVGDRNVDEAVLSLKAFIRNDGWMASSQPSGRSAGRKVDQRLIGQSGNHSIQQADVHVLPCAGFVTRQQRQKNAVKRIKAGNDVGE